MPTEIFRVEAGEDDGHEVAGVWDYTDGLWVGQTGDYRRCHSAYRFRNVTIPKGAHIWEARLLLVPLRGFNVGEQLTTIRGIKEPNTSPFTDNPLTRPQTDAFACWDYYLNSGGGVTTHDGEPDGSTVIDTTRRENSKLWNGAYLCIGAGNCRIVKEWCKETGTFVLESPFGRQVMAGTEYKVATGNPIRSVDLASIIQEIINQPEWKSGNAIGFKHLGDRSHRAYCGCNSYEGPDVPPQLEVTWEILTYKLSINTAPISGVEFALDGLVEATPFSADVSPGTYTITMPEIVTVNGQDYLFAGWADGPTERIRTIDIAADTTLTANYEVAPVTHRVNVESTPVTGVPVTVDDTSVGNTPVSVSVIEGNHTFIVPESVEA